MPWLCAMEVKRCMNHLQSIIAVYCHENVEEGNKEVGVEDWS
jgi:hypothetical protein